MQTLSKYLTQYLQDNLFGNGKAREGETFNEQLERILHEGIFHYRKNLSSSIIHKPKQYEKTFVNNIFNSLMNVENKESMQLFK